VRVRRREDRVDVLERSFGLLPNVIRNDLSSFGIDRTLAGDVHAVAVADRL